MWCVCVCARVCACVCVTASSRCPPAKWYLLYEHLRIQQGRACKAQVLPPSLSPPQLVHLVPAPCQSKQGGQGHWGAAASTTTTTTSTASCSPSRNRSICTSRPAWWLGSRRDQKAPVGLHGG